MLHSKRVRLAARAEREAAGESFWTDIFEDPLRIKILHYIDLLSNGRANFNSNARTQILVSEGLQYLTRVGLNTTDDFRNYLLQCPDEMVPTVIEAWVIAAANPDNQRELESYEADAIFSSVIKSLLLEHRISYDLVDGLMIPKDSQALHVGVIEPVLKLITTSGDWTATEKPFLEALRELAANHPSDAITDAGTALQAALTSVGCKGNALGPLIKSARLMGIFGAHDEPMLEGIDRILNWVSADRSNNGDSHKSSSASSDDAWMIVHIVGAIILRLSKGVQRP